MNEKRVGIRALKQNASEVIQMVKQGDRIVVTERGVPVAQITQIQRTKLDELIEAGLATPATRRITDLPPFPKPSPGAPSSEQMIAEQRAERI